MPYANNEALPDAIKTALPSAAQSIFRTAFNSAEKQFPGDEERANKIAWGAVKNAGYEKQTDGKWVKVSKNTAEFEAEILSVGVWNGDKFTQDDLDEMVKASKELAEVKPPLKLGHNNKQPMSDGMFSLGWVKAGSLRTQAGKLLATFSQVPDVIVNLIKKGLYKRVSSEVYFNYRKAGKVYKRVLAGVALLGADIPAVSNLADLDKYLAQAPDSGSFGALQVYSIEVDDMGSIKTHEGDNDMPYTKEQFEAEKEAKETALADAVKTANELKKFQEDQAEKDKGANAESFKAYCEKQVKEGKMTPASRDILTKDMDKLCYTIDAGFSISIEAFQEFMDKQGTLRPDKEDGKSGKKTEYANVHDEVDAKVKKYQADHKDATYQEALESVFDADEVLAKAYINDTPVDNSDDD